MRDLTTAAELIRSRHLSPVELLDETLTAIHLASSILNAYITVLDAEARAQATVAEREIAAGCYRGALHGIPVSVKDLYWTRGVRTTAGARILTDFVPTEDAAVVRLLKDAGATIVAKANMLEFAYAAVHPDFGATRNPWKLTHTTGGSSSGSAAAVAAGLDYGSFGSDTGGSIRVPAAFCGVVGLKPTYGLVSSYGMIPLSWSMDHAGPLGRTVRDVATLLQAVTGNGSDDASPAGPQAPDYLRPLDGDLQGLKIGVVTNLLDAGVDEEIRTAVLATTSTLVDAGASLQELPIPELEGNDFQGAMQIVPAEASFSHRAWYPSCASDYSDTVRTRIEAGLRITAHQYFAAQEARRRMRDRVNALQHNVDLLLLPTTQFVAPPLEHTTIQVTEGQVDLLSLTRMTAPFNLTGQPALSFPCGFTRDGLPIGVQLVGRHFEDWTVLRAGDAFQARTRWHNRTPAAMTACPC